jgi:hypothetical protein
MKSTGLAMLVVMISGCTITAPNSESTPPRWQVVPLGTESTAILVDTHTGQTWSTWSTPSEWRPMKR